MKSPRSEFTYEMRGDVVILVEHEGAARSVTNDAEKVISELHREGLDFTGKRVVYQDALGSWDELIVEGNRFVRFNLLNAPSLLDALATMATDHSPRPC